MENEKQIDPIRVLRACVVATLERLVETFRVTLRKYYGNPYFAVEFAAVAGGAIVVISYLLSRWLPFFTTFVVLWALMTPWFFAIGFAIQFQQFKHWGLGVGRWSDRLEAWSKRGRKL